MPSANVAEIDFLSEQENHQQILTTTLGNQSFGMPVLSVQDILRPRHVAQVPQAPADIAGLINLRGRIVTVIDLGHWLGFKSSPADEQMHIVVDYEGDLYSFLMDSVGDVVAVSNDASDPVPPNLPETWHKIVSDVLRQDDELILIIDASKLLSELAGS